MSMSFRGKTRSGGGFCVEPYRFEAMAHELPTPSRYSGVAETRG